MPKKMLKHNSPTRKDGEMKISIGTRLGQDA